jgi:hypothetical protein
MTQDTETDRPVPFANTIDFYALLGFFYAAWSRAEIVVDCAIWKLLGTTPQQTHVLAASMGFRWKATVLRFLLPNSDRDAEQIKGCLARISESLRNPFAHSFLASDKDSVAFIHRTAQGRYKAKPYKFTAAKFAEHVNDFYKLVSEFEKARGLTDQEIAYLAACAIDEQATDDEWINGWFFSSAPTLLGGQNDEHENSAESLTGLFC